MKTEEQIKNKLKELRKQLQQSSIMAYQERLSMVHLLERVLGEEDLKIKK